MKRDIQLLSAMGVAVRGGIGDDGIGLKGQLWVLWVREDARPPRGVDYCLDLRYEGVISEGLVPCTDSSLLNHMYWKTNYHTDMNLLDPCENNML